MSADDVKFVIFFRITESFHVSAGKQLCLPGRYGDLGETGEQHGRGEADESHNGPLQELQFSHQHIGGLRTLWDLLHEVQVSLVRQSEG